VTLLTIAQKLAADVGLAIPDQVVGSSNRSMVEVLSFANATGEELARRADWMQLTTSTTLTGDGTNKQHAMPSGFSRLIAGAAIVNSDGSLVRPLTRAEWGTLTATEGTPRYFLLEEDTVTLWPYLADASTATAYYITENWCSNGTAAWSVDDETSLIDENLFAKGLIVRWRRQKGMDYADHEAEYEAALMDIARFNDRSRV
jgi:hypothetical protein